MLLTGNEIKKRMGKDIVIEPFDEKRVNPNSYNLRLHNELIIYDSPTLDMRKSNKGSKVIIPEEGLILRPGTLYLGRTIEYTYTDNLAPMLEGRSSIGRLGIFVHATAGVGDVGFRGTWTLEISCIQPVIIYPNIEICQIMYHTIEGDSSIKYHGKYLEQVDAKESDIYKEFEKKLVN